ncbi:MAG: hypothetical protein ACREUV_07040 [Burkholderiales bacterium]
MNDRKPGSIPALLRMPEVNVVIFSFLLSFPWEMWQVPFYQGISNMPHWQAVKLCTAATVGDVAIALLAFWAVAIWVRSRTWIFHASWRAVSGFTSVAVAAIIFLEWLSMEYFHLWKYVYWMPTLPVVDTGLNALLQWILVPPLVVWFVRRQLT